jgi:hypothetical protein
MISQDRLPVLQVRPQASPVLNDDCQIRTERRKKKEKKNERMKKKRMKEERKKERKK